MKIKTMVTTAMLNEVKRGVDIGRRSHGTFIWIACEACGKERWVLLLKGNPKSKLCRVCAGLQSDTTMPGTFRRRGYVFVRNSEHPAAIKGYVKRATLVLEGKLGRRLNPGAIAHHLNHIRDDDRPENLVEMTVPAHMSLHNGRTLDESEKNLILTLRADGVSWNVVAHQLGYRGHDTIRRRVRKEEWTW